MEGNVIQIYDDHGLQAALKQRRIRNAIGMALGRAYPTHPWHVSVSGDSTVAQIVCPKLTTQYGMTLHCNGDTLDVERKAVRMAGELLERFRVSRTVGDFSGVRTNIRGEALGAARGEAN